MVRHVSLALSVLMGATALAANKEQARLENAGVVMEEILTVPDNILWSCCGRPNASSSFRRW